MADILTGAEVAQSLDEKTLEIVRSLFAFDVQPTLEIIRVGDNMADIMYERSAAKRCEKVGIKTKEVSLDEYVPESDLLNVIRQANQNDDVNGVLLLRPLPPYYDSQKAENALIPSKDVDGMTNSSLAGVFVDDDSTFCPCTAEACIDLLDYYNIDCSGKRAVVVGRSLVVGKPVAMQLIYRDATVTICHSKTDDLSSFTKEADILISAIGKANFITKKDVKRRAIVIDTGINTDVYGKTCGDVDPSVETIAKAITPVPRGVGSVTTSVLARHTALAALRQHEHTR